MSLIFILIQICIHLIQTATQINLIFTVVKLIHVFYRKIESYPIIA